jgi:glycosyltransferase involved in cell wall biosynthesis
MNPAITVYIPVYNREKYIKEAIDSVLAQTFQDFELILVDDGSTDNSVNIIKGYTDKRITLIEAPHNMGVRKAANMALKAAKGKYIVRLDSDDICVPERLEKQFRFMEVNPEVGLSGGQLQLFGNDNSVWNYPVDPDMIKAGLFFEPTISQGASILRRELVEKGYLYDEEGLNYAEDYELWYRLKGITKMGNIPDILIYYRRDEQNVTLQLKDKANGLLRIIHKRNLRDLGIDASERELDLHHILLGIFPKDFKPSDLKDAKKWSDRLISMNDLKKHYPEKAFKEIIQKKWSRLFYRLSSVPIKFVIAYALEIGVNVPQLRYYISSKFKRIVR